MDLLVYVENTNSRVRYIFNHVFNHVLGLDILLTTDRSFFIKSDIPKIQYSKQRISQGVFFASSSILFEQDVRKQTFKNKTYNNINVLFSNDDDSSDLPFDPFSASFYMLTRYEEYIVGSKDNMGRFDATDSIAYKFNFLNIPVVDYWILFVKKIIHKNFPTLCFKQHKFKYVNTIDVDNAFAYKGKGFFRTVGAVLKNTIQLNFKEIHDRIKVLFLLKNDPYDNYTQLIEIHNKFNLKTIFFFLLADYGKYDKSIHFKNRSLNEIIKDLSKHLDIGIHPSVQSIRYPTKLSTEINRLNDLLNIPVTRSRQHYIILNMPFYYQNLIKNRVRFDYSMGFPAKPGFRAGTSYDFYFFDLTTNVCTDLKVFPFSIMDVTLKDYMKLTPKEALSTIESIVNQVKKVDGCFISIWHNETLSYNGKWLDWDHVYENMIKYILYGKY